MVEGLQNSGCFVALLEWVVVAKPFGIIGKVLRAPTEQALESLLLIKGVFLTCE